MKNVATRISGDGMRARMLCEAACAGEISRTRRARHTISRNASRN
jgi:hypothetical protein